MSSLAAWLGEIGCDQYTHLLEDSGYTTVQSLSGLSDAELQDLGVFDSNHRRTILHKVQSGGMDSDLDNVLTDLTSVIADLEAFTVPTKVSTVTNPAIPQKTRSQKLLSKVGEPQKVPDPDFDLDSLLSDLTSFDPSKTVAASQPTLPQPQPPQPSQHRFSEQPPQRWLPEQHPSPARPPMRPASQTPPDPSPTPPSTPGHQVPRSRSITESSPSHNPHGYQGNSPSPRTMSISSPVHRQEVVTVPQPDLAGATEQISQEEEFQRLQNKAQELRSDESLTEEDREERMKAEKMKIGIEKMKLAHKKRVAIKVFNVDRSNKTVVVEEGMTTGMVCHLLVVKNHFDESPNWVLVEQLGDVSLERELEDHEQVVDVYSTWPREHSNVFLFKQNEKKYDLFEDPIKYFPQHLKTSQAASTKVSTLERAEKARKILLQEYFSSTSRVPELEGWLHLKDGYKKSWKKVFFILRASGLYYSTKGKQKGAKFLQLLVHFDEYELYHGINFKKTLKAPTPFCFALRPIPRQFIPGPKDIKVLCAEEESLALSWTAGIRLSKYGLQLRNNFHKAKLTQFKLEDLGAPEGSKPKADVRASKLVGLRLEKHMDKLREQYIAQREEQEIKKQHYHSPKAARRHNGEGSGEESEGEEEEGEGVGAVQPQWRQAVEHKSYSASPASHTPERTPEPSSNQVPPPVAPRPGLPPTALRPTPPPVAPRPSPPPPTAPRTTKRSNGVQGTPPPPQPPAPYNPFPPPSQPAPPPRVSSNQTPYAGQNYYPPQVLPGAPPTAPPTQPRQVGRTVSPEHIELFDYPWYHGAIPRDEAVKRLDGMGGYDGTYLVRDSTTVPNSYVLTMFAKGVSKNFQILPIEGQSPGILYSIDDGPSFPYVEQLLNHYKQDPDRLPCRLTDFCPRPPTRMTEC